MRLVGRGSGTTRSECRVYIGGVYRGNVDGRFVYDIGIYNGVYMQCFICKQIRVELYKSICCVIYILSYHMY